MFFYLDVRVGWEKKGVKERDSENWTLSFSWKKLFIFQLN